MFTIKLAGVNLLIKNIFFQTEMAFVDFISNEKFDYYIEITQQRIIAERELLYNTYPTKHFTDFEIETNALYRDIPKVLIKENIILFHGVLMEMGQKGYLFSAPSGTGKSTHARLWTEHFGNKVKIINGDKPLIKLTENGVYAYGSPWRGKEKIGSNDCVKLFCICHLQRSQSNSIEQVEFDTRSLVWLLEQTQIKGLESSTMKRVRWLKKAAIYVKLYDLKCNISDEAVEVAYNGINLQK